MNTEVTQITSKNLIDPIVRTILDVIQGQTKYSIDHYRSDIVAKLSDRFGEVLVAIPEAQKQDILGTLSREVDQALSSLRYQLETTARSLERDSMVGVTTPATATTVPIPGSPLFSWTAFVRRIRDMEAHNKFLAVKMLREKAFALEPENQEALQIAIDSKVLLTYRVENPKNPRFPTLACKMNRQHPLIIDILRAIGEAPVHGKVGESAKRS